MEDKTKTDVKAPPRDCPWGIQEEKLLAKWADKAACYRWLHDASENKYSRLNMFVTIPVIVLSTLTGTANFGLGSMVPSSLQGAAQLGIGGFSLITGIISTVANYLRYAQRMEAHRGAAISWGKLYRKISVELALARPIREKCMDFILVCRSEMDRLTEQSPTIPEDILKKFKNEFDEKQVELTDPIKWNDMEKTSAHPLPNEEQVAKAVSAATNAFKNPKLSELKKQLAEARKPSEQVVGEVTIPVPTEEKV
jgi:hypothetical protein